MDSVTDSGGRVTRSLRKRIPSVDSENTSRPGTPVPSKLTAITEISSPSRPARITRRNSITGVATPVKTPAKRVGATTSVISETTESVTPARRSTRRRSLSINESEGTPQAAIKAPAFDTLDEETPANLKQTVVKLKHLQSTSPQHTQKLNTPDKRVVKTNSKSPEQIKFTDKLNIKTEAKSPEQIKSPGKIKKTNDPVEQQVKTEKKSPQQPNNNSPVENKSAKPKAQQRRKPGPKSKTSQLTDEINDLSDVEVIVAEKENIINLINDDDDNNNQQDKLDETSPKQIKDNATSTQFPENITNNKIDQNVTTIDLMDCDDEEQLNNTNNMPTQEIQQNFTTIDLMESTVITIDLMECEDDQKVDNTDELSAKEDITNTNNLPESSTNESETSKINLKIPHEIAQNTENDNEEPTTTQMESTTVDINEEMSCEAEPHEASESESSRIINETLLNESKFIEISTKETLENKKTQETSEIESSVIVNESKSIEISTKETLENKKTQESSEIDSSVIINKTLLNESKSIEIPAIGALEINKPQETPDIGSAMIINETLNVSKSNEIPTQETLENKEAQETPDIETSMITNEALNVYKSDEISTKETKQETSVIINVTLNETKSHETPTEETLENNIQRKNKSQPIIEINDSTIDLTKSELNSHDLGCTSTQADEIISSITVNDDSLIDSKLEVEDKNKICTTPQPPQRKSISTIIEVINITPTHITSNASDDCKSSRNVDFILSPSGDSIIKSVYPKTPAFMKTKSLLNLESMRDIKQSSTNEETANTLFNENGVSTEKHPEYQQDNEKTISICEESNEMELNENTVLQDVKESNENCGIETPRTLRNVQLLNNSQSSTPIDSSKNKDDLQQPLDNKVEGNIKNSTKESIVVKSSEKKLDASKSLETNINNECTSIEKVATEIKWINPCVKGKTTEGDKLDPVVKPKATPKTSTRNEDHEMEDEHISQTRRCNAIIFSSGSEDEEETRVQNIINSTKESIVVKSSEKKLDASKSLETKPENNDNESTSIEKVATEIKWINPCVKGKSTEGDKLDPVVKPKATPKTSTVNEDHEMEDEHISQTRRCNAIIFSSGSEDEEEARVQQYDEEEEEELAPGEKPYHRKHVFHDDEAMEVEDYESGDSMDSEERLELLENEIPVDGESIGSNTTDDEHDEHAEDGEESENDSFIVSDSEEVEPLQLESSEDSDDEDDLVEDEDENDRKKKKTHKRIERSKNPLSSSDDEEENDTDKKTQSYTVDSANKYMNKSLIKSSDNNVLDTSKLSDTALRLQCTVDSDSEEQIDELNANISRKEILRNLNQSDRFNKSVRDLNPEVDTSPTEHNNGTQTISHSILRDIKVELQKSIPLENSVIKDKNAEGSESENDDDENQQEGEEKSSTEQDSSFGKSPDENFNVKHKHSKNKPAEFSHLGEVSVTTDSDNDKENTNKLSSTSNRNALSVSFGNFSKPKKQSTQRRSFTIGVSLKGGDLEAEIKSTKQVDSPDTSSSSSVQTSPSTNAKPDDELSSDDARYLENVKHMPLPLGNPLVRTRRQSLALPTNPDMEICSSSHGGTGGSAINKKTKRKSLGILSGHEFNPSQSFIDSMQLRKNEFDRQAAKRKRLSKSFCGTADTLDNSTIDIDVRHLHKRSKLSADNSIIMDNYDSMENINSSKLSTIVTTTSSTPREKAITNDSNNNLKRILSRCDEILEAANHAKLQSKLKNKKIKSKPPKKNRKKTPQQSIRKLHQDSDDKRKSITQDRNNEEKTKVALAQALKAAEVIIGKKKQKELKMVEYDSEDSKRLSTDILDAINKSEQIMKKKTKRDISCSENKMRNHHITSTAAGNFIDVHQTPEKKKKKVKIIQLPTGKVCVEPITPKHRSVLACNGTVFRESPISPFTVGFKVSHIPCDGHHASISKDRKRKRNFDNPTRHTLPKPQWTQSGLFIEEEIPTMRQIGRSEVTQFSGSRRLNNHQTENDQYKSHWNFKENTIMRHDVKRYTNRELLQLKERRQTQTQF